MKLSSGNKWDRCVAFISGDKLKNNIEYLCEISQCKNIILMVKSNAYGHGLSQIAAYLKNDQRIIFGVASLWEAKRLRELGVLQQIYLFDGGASRDCFAEIFSLGVMPIISNKESLTKCLLFARANLSKNFVIHLKFDTGFIRNGFVADQVVAGDFDQCFEFITESKNVAVEGLATHFPCADDLSSTSFPHQIELFKKCLDHMKKLGFDYKIVHCGNSATVLRGSLGKKPFFGAKHQHIIRPGIAAYGLDPFFGQPYQGKLQPVMSIFAKIVDIKKIVEGQGVGYGYSFVAQKPMTVAIVAMGYGDGLRRCLSNNFAAILNGQMVEIVGKISMDSCLVALDNLKGRVDLGDQVCFLGTDGNKSISAHDHAFKQNTICYEVLTSFTERLSRLLV